MSIPITKFGELKRDIEELEDEIVSLPFIVDNFIGKDGGEVSGVIDMTGQAIKNLPNPIDEGDAVPKSYVDNLPVGGNTPFNVVAGEFEAKQKLNLKGFNIENIARPVNDEDAANKIYVDTLTENRQRQLEANNPFNLESGEFVAKNKIDMKGNKIEGVGFPDLPEDVATVAYVDEANVWERKNGGFVAKDHIYLGRKKLGGLKDPTAEREAATKSYVDKELKKVADGTFKKDDSGFYEADTNINLNNFRMFGVPDPTRSDEITNKKYVDEKTANLQPQPVGVDPAELNKIKTDLEKNQAFNTRNQKTFNARGNINMKQKAIRNIPDPVEITDAVPLGFVNKMKEFFEDRIKEVEDKAKEAKDAADRAARAQPGGGAGNGNGADFGDMKGVKLINVGDPENSGDGVNKKYVDQKTPFTKTNGYYSTSHGIDMDFKKIINLNTPTGAGDAVNKKYVDDEIDNIETGFIRRNGGFQAVDAIDMNSNRIKNIGAPQVYDDVVNKIYVDNKVKPVDDQVKTNVKEIEKLEEEDKRRKTETDRIRVLVNEKVKEIKEKGEELKKYVDEETAKILPEERVFKFLRSSIILIQAEAEGPIIGHEEITKSNNRQPSPDTPGGYVALDANGEIIKPTILYFGKYDRGLGYNDTTRGF